MSLAVLLFMSFALATDAFAVSITNGMCQPLPLGKNIISSGLAFGFFQGLMPLIGYYAGHSMGWLIEGIDHWIALVLLSIIGGKMIYEAIQSILKPKEQACLVKFSIRILIFQAIATSIDALAVGITLGVMNANIWLAVVVIALVTFISSGIGVIIGKKFGQFLAGKTEILGGVILIGIGVRIFFEHTIGI